MRVHLTLKSSNSKTGNIPVSTTERASCGACPFKKNGCYGDDFHLSMHWDKVSSGERGTNWPTFCGTVAAMPDEQLWRHNQAGDLPRIGKTIDAKKMAQLVAANFGRRGFTYTHHAPTPKNLEILTLANIGGFIVNLSANDLAHADALAETGLPVVVVLPAHVQNNTTTPAGRPVVVCPATQRDDVTCKTCQLCARGDRTVIVGFPAHGASAKKADAVARRVISIKSI